MDGLVIIRCPSIKNSLSRYGAINPRGKEKEERRVGRERERERESKSQQSKRSCRPIEFFE
jgi:hypothetical protein